MPTRITYGIPTGFGSLMMINYDPCENWSVELVEIGPKVTWGGLRVEAAECSRERLTSGKNTFNRVNTLWADKAKYSKLFFFKSLFYKSSQSESEDWMLLRWEIKSIEKLIWAISCLGSRRQGVQWAELASHHLECGNFLCFWSLKENSSFFHGVRWAIRHNIWW